MIRYLIFGVCFLVLGNLQAQFNISGAVTNEAGEQILSASVFLVGQRLGAVTDADGSYIIKDVPAGTYEIKCTYVGYKSVIRSIEVNQDMNVDLVLEGTIYDLESIQINANRIDEEGAASFTNLDKEEFIKDNLGQDVPFLLRSTPSVVVTSDAGAGIGYTGIRLRGTDASRINVTINGVPLNDAESQGVFWVDLPDFMSSVEDVQIQRGVGSSTFGSGAFGGTISLNTGKVVQNAYAEMDMTYGSFNTKKFSARLGTGLLNDRWYIDTRYSRIDSDGYIDRARARLTSFAFTAGRVTNKSSLKFDAFIGVEQTYQAWYGVPIELINGDQEGLLNHYFNNPSMYPTSADSINLFSSDRRYNYYTYENQIDSYGQAHFQLHYLRELSENWTFKSTLHYTKGRGYFSEFKHQQNLLDYGLTGYTDEEGNSVSNADLVRWRYLDNHFFGGQFLVQANVSEKLDITSGLAISNYLGDHYGKVVSVDAFSNQLLGDDYYFGEGNKSDLSGFTKFNYKPISSIHAFLDLQLRRVGYAADGTDNDQQMIDVSESYVFFNPKWGISYLIDEQQNLYASFGVAQREPDRSDFVDHPDKETIPRPERLNDLELGYRYNDLSKSFFINGYYMSYRDQLVLNGALNDVGSNLRENVDMSYRAGVEAGASWTPVSELSFEGNITLSRNKIASFTEVLYDYLNDEVIENVYEDTDIAFSPSAIAGATISYRPIDDFEVSLFSKYVGEQYLDNTKNAGRILDAYNVQNLRLNYQIKNKLFNRIGVTLSVQNLFNELYSANGYTYSYLYGDLITERFLYPQAERHFLLGLNVKF